MTNNDYLQITFLDIVFRNRNKEYGAYALRKGYNRRLLVALFTGVVLVLLFLLFNDLNKKEVTVTKKTEVPGLVIKEIKLPEQKIKEVEKPKEIVKTKTVSPARPKLASVKFTSPPKISEVVKDPVPALEALEGKLTSDVNIDGEKVDKDVVIIDKQDSKESTGNTSGPSQPESIFTVQEKDPEFPGGAEAMKKFLARYLTTPDKLEDGEKRVIKIKFIVDKNGAVNSFEIVSSGGFEFDNEVIRVCKKMPRWIPAIQNGIYVPVNYVLPVTFIGVGE